MTARGLGFCVVVAGCVPHPSAPARPTGATVVTLNTGSVTAPDREAILAAVATAGVTPCYAELLGRNPAAYGDVVVRFTITPEGQAVEPATDFSTLADDTATDCILAAVAAVPFPHRDIRITVVYPFVLLTERTPPEVARALRDRYGLLSPSEKAIPDDPRSPVPAGVIVVW